MAAPILKIGQLSWQTQSNTILNKIGFSIAKGEVWGVIGPNGAGKTSLLRCIYQRVKDYEGEIYLKNKPVNSYSHKEIAQQISVVSQQTDVTYALPVKTIVEMGLLPQKTAFSRVTDMDRHQIEKAIAEVGLKDKCDQLFSQLSGGEQQRALIARALVQGAELLILDEPTNHLDVYYQHQILSMVSKLPLTIIMTVHDLNLAAQYCDKLLLLNKGEVVAEGQPHEVLTPEYLTHVFKLPCHVTTSSNTQDLKVNFDTAGVFNG